MNDFLNKLATDIPTNKVEGSKETSSKKDT
jgi:hypothetical protein